MSQRKAFNFYLSFFEVFEELPNDKEKISFIKALLYKQFYGQEPSLTGMAKFAYISQQQVINQQVEGWEHKTKTTLAKGGAKGGSVQGKGKGKGKEEEKGKEEKFELFWSKYPSKVGKKDCYKKWLTLKDSEIEKIETTIDQFIKYKPFKDYTHPNPKTYLNQERWNDEIAKPKLFDDGRYKTGLYNVI